MQVAKKSSRITAGKKRDRSTRRGRGKSKSNREEKRLIAQVDRGKLRHYVEGKVCSDILFPERSVV